MPVSLSFDACLSAVESAAGRLVADVEQAGLDAPVPTCPTWDARALLAHQAMVHRWAAAQIAGADPDSLPNQTELRESCDDLPGYFRQGVVELLATLGGAPDDLAAMTFLNDAPAPKLFWARRQCHETTIHAVDARSAVMGRQPTASELTISTNVALDGIDELLCGFYTRGRSKLFDGTEFDVVVAPQGSDRRWLLHVAERLTVDTDPTIAPANTSTITIAGTPQAIYLGLWNRGDELSVLGDETLMARWRQAQRVRWS